MANDAYTQQALAADPNFQLRIRANLMSTAWRVLEEPDTIESHTQRAAYARQVINNPTTFVPSVSTWIVMRPGVFNFETSYNFTAGAVLSVSGDLDIQGQLLQDWNEFAGVQPVPPPP